MLYMRTIAIIINKYLSPIKELIKEKEVPLKYLIELYQPQLVSKEDDSEV